jgi:hypothetical protein
MARIDRKKLIEEAEKQVTIEVSEKPFEVSNETDILVEEKKTVKKLKV